MACFITWTILFETLLFVSVALLLIVFFSKAEIVSFQTDNQKSLHSYHVKKVKTVDFQWWALEPLLSDESFLGNKMFLFKLWLKLFFSVWVFFHKHSRFTGQQGKGETISLTPLHHFHPLHGHLNISRAITAESSSMYIAISWTRTVNLWFSMASR